MRTSYKKLRCSSNQPICKMLVFRTLRAFLLCIIALWLAFLAICDCCDSLLSPRWQVRPRARQFIVILAAAIVFCCTAYVILRFSFGMEYYFFRCVNAHLILNADLLPPYLSMQGAAGELWQCIHSLIKALVHLLSATSILVGIVACHPLNISFIALLLYISDQTYIQFVFEH